MGEVKIVKEGEKFCGLTRDTLFYIQNHLQYKSTEEFLLMFNRNGTKRYEEVLLYIIDRLKKGTLICK